MKKHAFLGMLALLLVFGFVLAGCSTVDTLGRTNSGKFSYITVPDKDFTSLGLVFVETTYDEDELGARGDVFTYYALLQEAKKLGGDYIINVSIDVKTERTHQTIFKVPKKLIKGKVTWYGAATAIKYGNSLKASSTTVTTNSGGVSTTTTTSDSYYVNGAANVSGGTTATSGGSNSSSNSSNSGGASSGGGGSGNSGGSNSATAAKKGFFAR